jgi:DNA-binding IscR family transcriptional regulator
VKGGYAFARDPSTITVLEVVELLDGKLDGGAGGIFAQAASAARDVLAGVTLAELIEQEEREAGSAMYHI